MRLRARLSEFYESLDVLVHEVLKFGLVGAFNYLVDVGLFNVLVLGPLEGRPLIAKTVSTIVALTSSYFMNRHWTFRHRARSGIVREYSIFFLLSAIGLAITLACLGVSEYVLDQQSLLARNVSGNVVGVGLAMVFRFWSFKRWVFTSPQPERQRERDAAEAAVRTSI